MEKFYFKVVLATVLALCIAQGMKTGPVRADFVRLHPGANPAISELNVDRGFPVLGPWMVYYGSSEKLDLDQIAQKFRIIIIDADPHLGAFDKEQIENLKANKRNRVLSYLNIGACENYRSYWQENITDPKTKKLFKSCLNTGARLGEYPDFPEEVFMNPGNKDYQKLILDYVSVQLQQQKVDGFFFDNMDIIEDDKLCNTNCRKGGLRLIRKLRAKYPSLLFVMNGATSDITRKGKVGNVPFPRLIDGVIRESVFKPAYDPAGEAELLAWQALKLTPGGKQFFIGTLDFVGGSKGDCSATGRASEAYTRSRAKGFSPYASDSTEGLQVICYWDF